MFQQFRKPFISHRTYILRYIIDSYFDLQDIFLDDSLDFHIRRVNNNKHDTNITISFQVLT